MALSWIWIGISFTLHSVWGDKSTVQLFDMLRLTKINNWETHFVCRFSSMCNPNMSKLHPNARPTEKPIKIYYFSILSTWATTFTHVPLPSSSPNLFTNITAKKNQEQANKTSTEVHNSQKLHSRPLWWFVLCINWGRDCLVRSRSLSIYKQLFYEIHTKWFELVQLTIASGQEQNGYVRG